MDLEAIFILLVSLVFYGVIYLLTKNEIGKHQSKKVFFLASAVTFFLFSGLFSWSLFWPFFLVALIISVVAFLSSNNKFRYGVVIRNGVYGGFCLVVPVFILLQEYA